jgi:hypothetical protein
MWAPCLAHTWAHVGPRDIAATRAATFAHPAATTQHAALLHRTLPRMLRRMAVLFHDADPTPMNINSNQ